MPFKIPFTNFVLSRPLNADGKRPLVVGRVMGLGAQRELSGYKLSYESLFTAYRNQADIFSCIREWRENVGVAGYKLIDPEDNEAPVNQAQADEFDDILNRFQSFRNFKSRVVRDFGVSGNGYAAIVRDAGKTNVIGLQPLDPRTMSIVSTETGDILKYIQRVGSAVVEFAPEEILHFKIDSDPNYELFGFSPMETVIWEARTDLSAMMANYYFFENDAQPAVQFILEDGLSDEQIKQAEEQIGNQFKGVKNKNKSAVLSGIKEIKTFNISQKDMEFLQGRAFTTGKICAAYGVPKFMLGYTDEVNNNNGIELKQKFYESTIQPIEEMFAEVINDFAARIGLEDTIKFKFNPQIFDEQAAREDRGMKLYQGGAMTLRQLKIMLDLEITQEDEQVANFDKYIIQAGASAVLLDDVGNDSMIDEGNAAVAENLLKELKQANDVLRKSK